MFYKLKSNYLLRGWEGNAWILIQRPQNHSWRLTAEQFQALMLCDGETELSNDWLDENIRQELKQLTEDGLIEVSSSASPLRPEQYYKYYHNRYVERVFWSVTGRCNFRCRHCYMDAPDAALGELSTEEAFDLIDQMAECGVQNVDITGGEPFVRKDFWQLVDRILSRKMVINQVYTNGWLLDDSILDKFESRGLKPEFSISFDGVGWHDWMRGIPGAEEAALRAFGLCKKRGFYATASVCIHRGNVSSLPQTIEALRTVGVREAKTSNVDMTDLWRCHSEGNAMTQQEYMDAMIPYITWYYEAGRPIEDLEFGGIARLRKDAPGELSARYYDGTEACMDCYLCGATRKSCYITPEGRLLPCMPMTASPEQSKFPRVQDIGLQKGLSDSYYMQFVNGRVKDLFAANQECAGCSYRYKCGGGCRAAALTGADHDLMGCDRDDMCMFWKNHYDERILQTIREAEAKYPLPKCEVDT